MNQTIIKNLEKNGFEAYSFTTPEEVKSKITELIPAGSQVMTMSSVTLDTLGIADLLNNSEKYHPIRPKLYSGDADAKIQASMPEYAVGSLQAVTTSGQLVFASATGSQIPAYVYGAKNVILIIGTQKIVDDLDSAFKRIKDYVFPLEDARAMQAYGVHSSINKILIINKEPIPGRLKILFIDQKIGY
jgi:hypothetical protein